MIFLVSVLSLQAEERKSPVSFDRYEWNFGTIDPADGTVCHTFTFTNKSKSAVRIAKDIPSCDCIMAFYDDETVEPGGKAEVMIAYSSCAEVIYRMGFLISRRGRKIYKVPLHGIHSASHNVLCFINTGYIAACIWLI